MIVSVRQAKKYDFLEHSYRIESGKRTHARKLKASKILDFRGFLRGDNQI